INFKSAHIGGARDGDPRLFVMGAGPKALELATQYADGICTIAPLGIVTPEECEKKIKEWKDKVESYGRDPAKFQVMLYLGTMVNEDPEAIARACKFRTSKIGAALWGRRDQRRWYEEGLTPIFPDNWNYALHWLPWTVSDKEAREITDKVPDEMVQKSMI